MRANSSLSKRNKFFWGLVGVGLVILLGLIDYLTGHELAFSLFYLIPISLVTWYAGRRLGLVTSTASAIACFFADYMSRHSYSSLMLNLWNTLMPLGFFILMTTLLSIFRKESLTNAESARTDYVTKAVSVRYFYELAQREIERSRRYLHPFTLVYIDLDNFKEVNDEFGHSIGDKVLQMVAWSVQQSTRSVDVFARLGGDEFALLLPETGSGEARTVMARTHGKLKEEMQRNGWPVTFSLGVVTFMDIPYTVDEIIRMADDVMYSVKSKGKNGIKYYLYAG
jgi:diguanylate cyclase (GGDEF)-like protein